MYKDMQLRDKLPAMSEEEQLKLLATNGMLVKRPLIVDGSIVLTGFKETEWAEKLQEKNLRNQNGKWQPKAGGKQT